MPAFLMTYPCYVVVRENGWPDTIRTPDGRAIALFTDDDLAERYCRAKRGAILERSGQDVREFQVVGFEFAEALLGTLHQNLDSYAKRGIEYVAMDPTPGKRATMSLPLTDFLADLEESL